MVKKVLATLSRSLFKDIGKVLSSSGRKKLSQIGRSGYRGYIPEKKYNKVLNLFADEYNNLKSGEELAALTKSVGGTNFYKSLRRQAIGEGLITDTKKGDRLAPALGWKTRIGREDDPIVQQMNLKNKRRAAIMEHAKDITKNALKNKEGVPLLSYSWKQTHNLLPGLKKKNPGLFDEFDVNNPHHLKSLRRIITGENTASSPLKFPRTIDTKQTGEEYFRDQVPDYVGRKLSKIENQYLIDARYRSRDTEFRAGDKYKDVHNYLKFLRGVEDLDPASPNFFNKTKEFADYRTMREIQPARKHLAHTYPTLNPGGTFPAASDVVPYSGGELEHLLFLGKRSNEKWQKIYEQEITEAMLADKRHLIPTIEQKMIDKSIVTRIKDPVTGDVRPYGGTKGIGFAGGGLIRKGLEKLLKSSAFSASRRKFLKQSSTATAMAAMPGSVLKGIAKTVTPKISVGAALKNASPWMKGLYLALNQSSKSFGKPLKLKSGATVESIGPFKPFHNWKGPSGKESNPDGLFGEQPFSIRTKSGELEEVLLENGSDQISVSFKLANYGDDFGGLSDQHLVFNKKTGSVSHIDDNLSMQGGGEDIVKDDWIEQGVGMSDIRKSTTKELSSRDMDFLSKPNTEGRYDDIFESMIDSFSPSGGIFRSAEKAKIRQKKIQREAMEREEMSEMNWEDQFRGGRGMHGYQAGGIHVRGRPKPRERLDSRKKLQPRSDQAIENRRMTRLRHMSDVEAMARMMYAESDKDFRDAKAIGHVIANRAGFKIDNPVSTFMMNPKKNLSLIKRAIAGDPAKEVQFTPFRSKSNLNFWDVDMTEDNEYYKYAKKIMLGQADDFTQGATMFDLDPNKYAKGYNEYWNFNPSQFAPDEYGRMRPHEGPHSFWNISSRKNRGGMAEKFNVDDAVAMIRAAPQSFVGGGLVKKFAPKVLGKLTQYATRARPTKTRLYKPPKGPYTITDASGARMLDKEFKTLTAAQKDLKELAKLRTTDASTFKIFGKRPSKTKEGVWESAPEVNLSMVGKEFTTAKGTKYGDPDKPGAIFWGSREKIVGAPQESMTGGQWMDYLVGMKPSPQRAFKEAENNLKMVMEEGKDILRNFTHVMKTYQPNKPKFKNNRFHPEVIAATKALQSHKLKVKQAHDVIARLKLKERATIRATTGVTDETIMASQKFPAIRHEELNDTSLAPFLSKYKDKAIPKKVLVDAFDRIAPKMNVEVAGREIGEEMMTIYAQSLKEIDPKAFRGAEGEFFSYLKSTQDQLKRGLKPGADKAHKEEAKSIMEGINKFVSDNYGVPNALEAGVPQKFPYEMKQALSRLSSAAGKRTAGFEKYSGRPQYAGTQTLGGGENPREILFRSTPGAMRKGEPVYKYGHEFSGIPKESGKNAFVHARISDRTDEFGRRIIFIEEVQSDMHQPIRMAQKNLKNLMARKARGENIKDETLDEAIKRSKYASRGDVPIPMSESHASNKAHFDLIVAKIDDLAAQPQTVSVQKRIVKLNKERAEIRKILQASRKKAEPETSGIPQGPYSKTEDYNEFVIKYATKMAQEGDYDGVALATSAIKNRGLRPTDENFTGNLIAYGPVAQGAMNKVAKKSGAKFIQTAIIDDNGIGWKVPMIWLDKKSKLNVARGLPAYKRGGIAING